ncbi:MAG: phosphotransferase, partial [Bdellovibrionales bacterium]|nr:phosphotransferase [Bdellovibrionales bacterium]
NRSEHLPFKNCHIREIEILSKKNPIINAISPSYLGSFIDFNKEAFVLIQEMIDSDWTVSQILNLENWSLPLQENVIKNMSQLHVRFLNQEEQIKELCSTVIQMGSVHKIDEQMDLWDSLFTIQYSKLKTSYVHLFKLYEESLENFEEVLASINSLDQSLIHYDLNPRNIAFNSNQDVKVFDWEFAAIGLPQRDLVELVLFSCFKNNVVQNMNHLSRIHFDNIYRNRNYDSHQLKIKKEEWEKGMILSLQEIVVKRLPFYFILSELSFCPYIDRLLENIQEVIISWNFKNDQIL